MPSVVCIKAFAVIGNPKVVLWALLFPNKSPPQPAIYMLPQTSTKKAEGTMSGNPLPVPTTVENKVFDKFWFKQCMNCPLLGLL